MSLLKRISRRMKKTTAKLAESLVVLILVKKNCGPIAGHLVVSYFH